MVSWSTEDLTGIVGSVSASIGAVVVVVAVAGGCAEDTQRDTSLTIFFIPQRNPSPPRFLSLSLSPTFVDFPLIDRLFESKS
ncbi:hypothetical protein Nepgr_020778 [Nepenthes gracilis]|uniref:Uncharacterized protein n=1 Tax=Nepenthes gracilis TaxID=150966 RepID=A0AAD3SXJ9_NEPGR|nr:hypothetical protein Nepgr_020778 [Nepenthes gracilis]